MTLEHAVRSFCEAAIQKGSIGSHRDHELFEQLRDAYLSIVSQGVAGQTVFRDLLKHPSADVRCWVAAQLAAMGEAEAVDVLRSLAVDSGPLGFNANITLHELELGHLRPPFGSSA